MKRWISDTRRGKRLDVAIIGSGISGLSAAWLLNGSHDITLYEADSRTGGHSNTVDVKGIPVDTGFMVYNEATYPNLTALFRHFGVPTKASEMSFGVSMDEGRLEYSGTNVAGLFAQKGNLISPRFWSMLRDLVRFYREAPRDAKEFDDLTVGQYLDQKGYGTAFRDDHLYPMAAAIWSAAAIDIERYPAAAFIRFCENHGLLKFVVRPLWRTVAGGSRIYVDSLTGDFQHRIVTGEPVRSIRRTVGGVEISDVRGNRRPFDHVVIATHADQALDMLADATVEESQVLGAFRYSRNETVLHTDARLMPRRKSVWSSWNYLSSGADATRRLCVTYWMNRLQSIPDETPLFVTLNPTVEIAAEAVIRRETYEHPLYDSAAFAAQSKLWSLQGAGNTWFCGAYFGAGFHEDGLQAGLAVAEALGGVRRPWVVPDESGRIQIGSPVSAMPSLELAS